MVLLGLLGRVTWTPPALLALLDLLDLLGLALLGLLGMGGVLPRLARLGLLVGWLSHWLQGPCTHTASLGLAAWLLGCLPVGGGLGALTSALLLLPDSRAAPMGPHGGLRPPLAPLASGPTDRDLTGTECAR